MPKKAVQHASKTLKNIRSVYVQDKSATVRGGEVDEFRVNLNSLLKWIKKKAVFKNRLFFM